LPPSGGSRTERLLRPGARFAAKAIVVDAVNDGTAISADVRRIGPALVFERLWEETGCRAVIEQLTGERKHGFALEPPSSSPCCIVCSPADPTGRPIGDGRITGSMASRGLSCIISIGNVRNSPIAPGEILSARRRFQSIADIDHFHCSTICSDWPHRKSPRRDPVLDHRVAGSEQALNYCFAK
jgi:hypothetical protein